MKKRFLVFMVFLSLFSFAKADEGMWLPMFIERLNYTDMQEMGLQLTAEEIYSINNSSLKDAIIIFGGGCTGEIVSDQGLILTNHHCGYGAIQSHSTIDHDYLTDGFWAMNKEEELKNPGLKASFLVRIEDVTDKVLAEVNDDMTETERNEAVRKISKEISDEAIEGTHYDAYVRGFFKGNEYYLFVYEIFNDIRLVGAPPSSIGKYGADTDNWMWPRHTGDFSMFRVYTAPDGSPAEYSEENIPLKPKHHLPISIDGVKKGDFAMIMGYPGGTERYLTSWGVELAIEQHNPSVVKIREEKLAIMREDMDASDEVRIKYASKYARTSNYWKYYIGQTKGLKRLKVADKKRNIEEKFNKWATSSDANEVYAEAMSLIPDAYEKLKPYDLFRTYFFEAIYSGPEIIALSRNFAGLKKMLSEKDADQEKINGMISSLQETMQDFYKDYNLPTDKKLFAAMLKMYYENIPSHFQPQILKDIASKYKGDFNKYTEKVFSKSVFPHPEKMNAFFEKPKAKVLDKDPVYVLMKDFFNFYREKSAETMEFDQMLQKGERLFVAGLRKMNPDKKYYPDANFTMRLTYGTVEDYYPADAVHYHYLTTLEGVMEKEDPNNWEFVVPEKLKKLYEEKDYGEYGEDGRMYTCFLTNHDITGGNSGSPVMNAKGELIGIAFDGNWEAMSGDIAFEPELQRTINVDIRYVLFVIDKYAGAKNLIKEMDIVNTKASR